MVAHILDKSGNYDITDPGLASFLNYAASGACLDIIKQATKMSLFKPSRSTGWSPLHWACRAGDFAVAKYLLELGFEEYEVETFEPVGRWTPLRIALYHHNAHLQQIQTSSLTEYLRKEESKDAISSPSIAQKARPFCNRCFHVRTAHPYIMTGFHTIIGYIRSQIQVLCLLRF